MYFCPFQSEVDPSVILHLNNFEIYVQHKNSSEKKYYLLVLKNGDLTHYKFSWKCFKEFTLVLDVST